MEKAIEDIILTLSPNKQLLFGISCVIRMESFLESYLISLDKRSRFVPISQLTDKVGRKDIGDGAIAIPFHEFDVGIFFH